MRAVPRWLAGLWMGAGVTALVLSLAAALFGYFDTTWS